MIKLNLSICDNIKISLLIPIEINENLDILNSSSAYYNDICYTTTSENGTDIPLNDRKNEFIQGDKTICQDDCILSDYNEITKKANCSCNVQEMSLSFKDMNINKTKLYNNFIDIKNIANINILKCYQNLFNIIGIIYNMGNYIIILIIIFHLVSIFVFYLKQLNDLKNKINKIVYAIKNLGIIKKSKNSHKKATEMIVMKKNNKKKYIKKTKNENKKNKFLKENNENRRNNHIIKINKPFNINFKNRKEDKKKKNKKQNSNKSSVRKKLSNIMSKIKNEKKIKEIQKIMELTYEEKNSLSFELAILYDRLPKVYEYRKTNPSDDKNLITT